MKKILIVLALLLLTGCSTYAERTCEKYGGTMGDKHHCTIGDGINSDYIYIITCGKSDVVIYTDEDIIDFQWSFFDNLRCDYYKIDNRLEDLIK